MVIEDDETSKDKEIDKLMALISLSFKKTYKPTNNNLRTSLNTSRTNQDNSPRINKSVGYENQRIGNVAGARETKLKKAKDAAYHKEKMILCKQEEAGIQLNAKQADWRDDTDDDELEDQELEAHYMYMPQLQEVSPDAVDCGPIFDDGPLQKNDDDNDLATERELLASLIEKLKCEIDESKNRNKFLDTSNKVLIEKLKGEIKDFKNKNKSLESSNNFFKEANNRLSETNNLLYADYKKSEAKLARRNSREYASQMELDCAKDLRAQLQDKGIVINIVLFIVESGCSKHMTRNLKLLINFVEKFLGTVKFRNDQIAPILGYGDLVQGAVTIKRVYYVEGLNYNLFFIGQFCDVDLEVAFRKSTSFIRDLM
nr:integrase, catalytic region, zinc finger, CCHC-type, peptidase aspartic, catalytic [Tanacetum cinerariifolium]